jgi:hypothetical protein
MKTEDMALHKEGTAEGYLGVDVQQHENQITFTQIGLTKCIIDTLGLDSKILQQLPHQRKRQHQEEMSMVPLPFGRLTMLV